MIPIDSSIYVRRKVALAHHWLVAMRGGERVLAVLADMFPDAPIYTLFRRDDFHRAPWAQRSIRTSFLQKLAWVPGLQRKALPLLPMASRSLDASAFDVVICSDASTVKAIRTRPDAVKICYCHSPVRYVWDLYSDYMANSGPVGRLGLRLSAPSIRRSDRAAASSVTAFVANSWCVADRIKRAYGRSSVVIPPPVETDIEFADGPAEDFYLVVGEHVPYKRHDLAIEACLKIGRRLVVIGGGPGLVKAHRYSDGGIEVLDWQPDDVVWSHYRRCRALLFCGEEDFGIVPVEVQAAGRPVIAYGKGGALDSVVDGQTGVFFNSQDVDAVADAILRFEATALSPPEAIHRHAQQFSKARFVERFHRFYDWCMDRAEEGGNIALVDAMEHVDRRRFLSS